MTRTLLSLLAILTCACTTDNGSAVDDTEDLGASAGGQGGGGAGGGGTGGETVGGGRADLGPVGGAGGSDGGAGGLAAPDARVGDAAAPDACGATCERIADCASEVCGDAAAGARAAILEDCATTCAANPSFEIIAGGIATCDDLVDFGRQSLGATFGTVCDPGVLPPETYPVCDIFGERIATCLTAACAPLAEVAAAAAGAYRTFCNGAANNGEFSPDDLAMYLTPETPCDAHFIADIVVEQTGEGGDLAGFCANGPYTEGDTCAAACAAIGPCIEPGQDGQELRDPDFCAYICGVSANPPAAVWACLAETGPDRCEPAGQCFALGVVEEPACETYAARVASCTAEPCPAVAPFNAGLELVVRQYCNRSVQADEAALAVVRGVSPETPCDDMAIAPLVTGLTADDPEQAQDGLLAPFCAAMGGRRTPEACTAACTTLSPCIPEDTGGRELRDPDYCEFYCGTDQPQITDEQWTCIGAAAGPGCDAVLQCFSPPQ